MGKITKAVFIASIGAVQLQMCKDAANADVIGKMFGNSEVGPYDNSSLITTIISLLQVSFPRDAYGFCEIENYCFYLNFGKVSEEQVITVEDLWYQLTKEDD